VRLVIVESPNKTAKIRGFLGPGYQVAASYGHVRDLPMSGDLAVGFAGGRVLPKYLPLERAGHALANLRRLADQAEEVLLATDPDREGEAIAWHLAEVLGERRYRRVVFNQITKPAVTAALANARLIDRHLVDAQQARRVLDRVVGWLVSPTLRRLGKDARSAGRVQSVALRLVAEREREIQRFTAAEYHVLAATLQKAGVTPAFVARLAQWKGEPLGQRLIDATVAERTVEWCRKQRFVVHACDRRERDRHPPPPFITATVQQAASVRLKLAPDATMKLLQSLFEGGHITYHRTDSVALAPESIQAARAIIAADFPAKYLPKQPVAHAAKSANAQEAHEAIRPTHPETGLEGPETLDASQRALYGLIWTRFVASQMATGRDQITTLDVACAPGTWNGGPMGVFRAKGRVVLFDGWRRLTGDDTEEVAKKKARKKKAGPAGATDTPDAEEEQDVELPLLTVGDALDLIALVSEKKSTKPPPRFTQASLIKRLERDGIGRPSTYANILKTILDRGYVQELKRLLHATDLGMAVTDFLVSHFAGSFIDLGYTARLEDDLDRIARGEVAWEKTVTDASFAVLDLAQRAGLRGNPLAG